MADVIINNESNESVKRYNSELSKAKYTMEGLIKLISEFEKLNSKMEKVKIDPDVKSIQKKFQQKTLEDYAANMVEGGEGSADMINFAKSLLTKSIKELQEEIKKVNDELMAEVEANGKDSKGAGVLSKKLKGASGYLDDAVTGLKEPDAISPALPALKESMNMMKSVSSAVDDTIDGMKGLDEETKKTVKSVTSVISGVADGILKISDLGKTSSNALSDTSKSTSAVMNAAKDATAILGLVSLAIQVTSTLMNLFGDGAKERQIKKRQRSIDDLSIAYDRLENSLEGTYASDSVKILEEQNGNLEEQRKLVEEQMELEGSKKNTDQKKMNDYRKNLDKINNEIKANENQMVKAIIGKDVKEAINDFATAYVNAWEAGTDKAKAMKDVVKSMIKSAIGEFVKARLSGEVEEFTKYLAKAMEDGVLSEAEQRELAKRERAIEKKGEDLDEKLSWAKEEKEPNRIASSKGIAQASQESIDDLSGIITGIQGHTYGILEEVRKQGFNNQEILSQIRLINESATHLRRLEVIEKRISSMDSNINSVVLKGIKLNDK